METKKKNDKKNKKKTEKRLAARGWRTSNYHRISLMTRTITRNIIKKKRKNSTLGANAV